MLSKLITKYSQEIISPIYLKHRHFSSNSLIKSKTSTYPNKHLTHVHVTLYGYIILLEIGSFFHDLFTKNTDVINKTISYGGFLAKMLLTT